MKTTHYFRTRALRKHPEIRRHYHQIETALTEAVRVSPDPNQKGGTRRWIYLSEVDKYMRVVVLADGETIHNAFYDRGFKP